jgi:uncharacterized SAM-binding protein YcdF (DUF218 family)
MISRLFRSLGIFLLVWLLVCLTTLPVHLYRSLSRDPQRVTHDSPDAIVVLGGGGIPSESGLLRCYHGAEAARRHPGAEVIVSLPADGDPDTSSVGRMRDELVMRGVERTRIRLEHDARSTHEQAEAIALIYKARSSVRVQIITSEYHVRRSLLAFRRAGLDVSAGPAAIEAPEADMGGFTTLRYRFWHNLSNSVVLAREWLAILAYRLRGWA